MWRIREMDKHCRLTKVYMEPANQFFQALSFLFWQGGHVIYIYQFYLCFIARLLASLHIMSAKFFNVFEIMFFLIRNCYYNKIIHKTSEMTYVWNSLLPNNMIDSNVMCVQRILQFNARSFTASLDSQLFLQAVFNYREVCNTEVYKTGWFSCIWSLSVI
jgi:hypothetical protein